MTLKQLILTGGLAVVLIPSLGIGGYFLYLKMDRMHEENAKSLSNFGINVIPVSQSANGVSIGIEGQTQLPPSIPEKKLSPTEKVIIALSNDKEALMTELNSAQQQIETLEIELALLKSYRTENERYAPGPLREERSRAIEHLSAFFEQSRDAARFSAFQKEAMTLASANIYMVILRKYRLSFDQTQKDTIIKNHLPQYGFCLGDGIPFLANNLQEQKVLLGYLKSGDVTRLSKELEEDFQAITRPCMQTLNERVNKLL
jgi:hypothetical protein